MSRFLSARQHFVISKVISEVSNVGGEKHARHINTYT
jgi:hypothetical protein